MDYLSKFLFGVSLSEYGTLDAQGKRHYTASFIALICLLGISLLIGLKWFPAHFWGVSDDIPRFTLIYTSIVVIFWAYYNGQLPPVLRSVLSWVLFLVITVCIACVAFCLIFVGTSIYVMITEGFDRGCTILSSTSFFLVVLPMVLTYVWSQFMGGRSKEIAREQREEVKEATNTFLWVIGASILFNVLMFFVEMIRWAHFGS